MWCLYSVNLCNGELKIPYETEIQEEKNKTKHTHKKTEETNQRNKKERLKSNFPYLHCCHWPFSNWRRIIHLQSPSKLTENRWIKSDGLFMQYLDRSIFRLRRIICLARIIQRITRLRRIILL